MALYVSDKTGNLRKIAGGNTREVIDFPSLENNELLKWDLDRGLIVKSGVKWKKLRSSVGDPVFNGDDYYTLEFNGDEDFKTRIAMSMDGAILAFDSFDPVAQDWRGFVELLQPESVENVIQNITKISNSSGGFAGGSGSLAGAGVALGKNAKTVQRESPSTPIDAIQLGTGENNTEKTLQVYNTTLLDANGKIPNK